MISLTMTSTVMRLTGIGPTRFKSLLKTLAPLAAGAVLLSACASTSSTALGTNVPLTRDPDLNNVTGPGTVVWRSPDLATYERMTNAYFIPPATVYRGRGSFFSDLSPQQVDDIAAELTREVRTEIGKHFKVVNETGKGIFTLNLVLVRVSPPHEQYVESGPYPIQNLAIGMPENAPGTSAGTMTVAGKFLDSETGKLLAGFSVPVSPQVMDLAPPGKSARAFDFAQAASQQFADDLVKAIIRTRRANNVPVEK
jgi:hypothetical protein